MTDCFTTLGLHESATTSEVTAAYRALALQAHPDAGGDAERFATLHAAYREALKRVSDRVCATCGGSRRVVKQVGFSQLKVPCPDC